MTSKAELLQILEDTATLLQKTQVNLKKCSKSRLTRGYIDARLKVIEEYWVTFKRAHNDLVKLIPAEQKSVLPYFANEDYYVFEELYLILRADLHDLLSDMKQSSTTNTSAQKTTMSSTGPNLDQMVKLPRIELPTFNGNYDEWTAFHDLFLSLVHDNTTISDVQKLHYLKCSVTGEAQTLLKHIQVTQCNYTKAWNILKNRYGNKRLILNSVLKKLFNQKKVTCQSSTQIKNLLDVTTECLNSLQNLNIPTDSWDPVINFLIVNKLDTETHREWEQNAYKEESEMLPTWEELKKFLQAKYRTLELVTATSGSRSVPNVKEKSYHVTAATSTSTSLSKSCIMCKEQHTLCHCKEFTKLQPNERSEYVKTNNLCYNCLVPGHAAQQCRLPMSCRLCKRRHHTLLHRKSYEGASEPSGSIQPKLPQYSIREEQELKVNSVIASHHSSNHGQGIALLATAIVEAKSDSGNNIKLRALIDQGSQAAFISEKAAQLLRLQRQPMKGTIIGVGSTKTGIKHLVQFHITSQRDSSFSLPIQAYVMSKQLTTRIPTETIETMEWPHLMGLHLADPTYFKRGSIDLLLGVKEYAKILEQDFIKGPPGTPCAQKTSLGWILFGDISTRPHEDTYVVMHHQVEIEDMLKSFWEVELDDTRKLTKEEELCEQIYEKSTTRNEQGRYIVQLPFNTNNPKSKDGNTKEIATKRLMQLERKFRKVPNLKTEYTKVIQEYKENGYIEEVPEKEKGTKSVYLPHHAVLRENKETTRTRIVFDASCKGYNNISLNDELHVGPILQEDLRSILMRWRMNRVCFMADIKKMYLQILVAKQDTDYQRILWRPNETDNLKEYRLLRVTFGTAAAPYLAVRTLQQVANDEGAAYQQASNMIREDFYMDDLLSGADSPDKAIKLAKEVTYILQKGGFELTKWSSNNIQFIQSIEKDKRSSNIRIDMNLDGAIKALGITWNFGTDNFEYNIKISTLEKPITKRNILSDIQKLYDPLGWIAPCTVMSKILIQKLWLEKITWDEKVSETLEEEWRNIKSDFVNVNDIKIKRWLSTTDTNKENIQLHGFSDASMRAYAATVYIRIENKDGKIENHLVAARTRVAPLKTISLPRLELCGAHLLAKLMKQVGVAMRISKTQMYAWTDSSIVIAWLSGEPNRWKAFVANRVVEIIQNINNKHWNYVQSHENPADIASRGMLLSALKECDLWWKGPSWLSERNIKISPPNIIETELEMKTKEINTYLNVDKLETTYLTSPFPEDTYAVFDVPKTTHLVIEEPEVKKEETKLLTQFENFENLNELLKAIAYCNRFLRFKKNDNKVMDEINTKELEESLNICIKKTQELEFKEEIERLLAKKQVKLKSKLKSLNPFVDDKGILRVGGRLRHANLHEQRKYPIILGNNNALTPLIIADAHDRTIHGGIQLMLCYLRSNYWIMKAKSLVKKHVHKCLVCAKIKTAARTQIMGDLPKQRVNPSRPFLNSGVDFAGPFQTLMCRGRGVRTTKTYVAIFVCTSTKAIHIELVGDLTSEAFIGAFRRFVARRGKCNHLWSDQGRNFVGANKQLVDAWNEAKLQFTGHISQLLATEGTQWHFIPAYSPHFGGLWEAGVKSIKYHLRRIVTTNITYEEMTTVLCQIEACLNSRPLCPIDDTDPDNLNVLTPGHFLIGDAPIVVPSPDLRDTRISTLSRWQHTQKMVNDFWRRWQGEYLSRLQQRPKWWKTKPELQIGDIVLIRSDHLPPAKWALGRIVDKHPGEDGYTRVYSVRSDGNVSKRPAVKLCPLPISSSEPPPTCI